MFVPFWMLALLGLVTAGAIGWAVLVAKRRNPLPFPDPGSRIFTAASVEGKAAIVALLEAHGIRERFQFDSSGIRRSIMWDGTIINLPPPESRARLGNAAASIGLVAADPEKAAREAAEFLRAQAHDPPAAAAIGGGKTQRTHLHARVRRDGTAATKRTSGPGVTNVTRLQGGAAGTAGPGRGAGWHEVVSEVSQSRRRLSADGRRADSGAASTVASASSGVRLMPAGARAVAPSRGAIGFSAI